MIESTKLNYKPHRIRVEVPDKCTRPIKAGICGSTRFLVYDEPVRLRGVACRHYRCQECKADYYVADLRCKLMPAPREQSHGLEDAVSLPSGK